MSARTLLAVLIALTPVAARAQTACITSNCVLGGTPPECANLAAPRTTTVAMGGGSLVFTPANPKIEPGDCILWLSASLEHSSASNPCSDDPGCASPPIAACLWDTSNVSSLDETPSSTCFYDPATYPPSTADNYYCRIHASPTFGTMRGTLRVTSAIHLTLAKTLATNSVKLTWNGGGIAGDITYKVERQSGGDPRFPSASTAALDPDAGSTGAIFTDTGDLANTTARYYLIRNKQSNEP